MWENAGSLGLSEAVNVESRPWKNGEEPSEKVLVCSGVGDAES